MIMIIIIITTLIIISLILIIIIRYPDLFDVVIAADVIYEDSQIIPLITTVVALLKGTVVNFLFIYSISIYL